jgi:hypothetical protein
MTTTPTVESAPHRLSWPARAGLLIAARLGMVFVATAALPYFRVTADRFRH